MNQPVRIKLHSITSKPHAMDLILKPLEHCNYACTYCSSTHIAPPDNPSAKLSLSKVSDFLDAYPNTRTIIINGGEPLLMGPRYYWDLLALLHEKNSSAQVSITSNLEVFYRNPDEWTPLFLDSQVSVCTSFEYGNLRRTKAGEPLTEQRFLDIHSLFHDRVGYKLDFISVITRQNFAHAIDNVRLAQRLGVQCKLNYAVDSGDHAGTFLLPDIYRIYLDIHAQGLSAHEYSTTQMVSTLLGRATSCPLLRECDSHIRALNPGGDYYSCGALADDKRYAIKWEEDLVAEKPLTPLQADTQLVSMHDGCFSCNLFAICNGCKKTVADIKRRGLVNTHCTGMKSLETEILHLAENL